MYLRVSFKPKIDLGKSKRIGEKGSERDLMEQRRTHVVVGAGPSGIMLVNLLLDMGDNVIMIEQGDESADSHEDSARLIDWSRAAQREKSRHHDGATIVSEKQQHMFGRTILYPQGYGVGGTSSINAGIWSGGSPAVFDHYWPPSWSSVQVEGYFMTAHRVLASKGMLSITSAAAGLPSCLLLMGEIFSNKHPQEDEDTSDMTHEQYKTALLQAEVAKEEQERADEIPPSVWSKPSQSRYYTTGGRHGKRARLGNILRNHQGDGKLTLRCNSRAAFVVFEGTRAVGVAVPSRRDTESEAPVTRGPHAELAVPRTSDGDGAQGADETEQLAGFDVIRPSGGGEVVLCCGAIESPRLLIASGLRGAVLAHPASTCGRAKVPQTSGAKVKSSTKDKAKSKVSKGRSRPGSRAARGQAASTLPLLTGIGSHLQDHVVVPVLALGKWHGLSSASSLLAMSKGTMGTDDYSDSVDTPSTHLASRRGRGWGSKAPRSRSRLSGDLAAVWSILGRLMQVSYTMLIGCITLTFYLIFKLWLDVLTGRTTARYHSWCDSMLVELEGLPANGVHGWIDLDAKGQVLDQDFSLRRQIEDNKRKRGAPGQGLPRAQLLVVDGGVAVNYVAELLLPRFDGASSIAPRGAREIAAQLGNPGSLASTYEGYVATDLDLGEEDRCGDSYDEAEWYRASRLVLSMIKLLYARALRPVLFRLVQTIVSTRAVQLLMRKYVFGFLVCLTGPRSKGRLTQAVGLGEYEEDNEDHVTLDLNLLSDFRDTKVLHNAMAAAHYLLDLSRQRGHAGYVEALPGLLFHYGRPLDYFQQYVGLFGSTYFHVSGSCRMHVEEEEEEGEGLPGEGEGLSGGGEGLPGEGEGLPGEGEAPSPEVHIEGPISDREDVLRSKGAISRSDVSGVRADANVGRAIARGAVVDEKLRVLGVEGLRVADTSVMPCIASGPTAACAMMIGVAAFDFLRADKYGTSPTEPSWNKE